MASAPFSTVIGVFADNNQANRAIDELRRANFSYGRIRMVERGTGTFKDTLKGLFTGQASTASSTADDLVKMGMPEQDANYYQNELDNGGILIIMNADDRPEQAFNVMRQIGAFDINCHLKMDRPYVAAGAASSNGSQAVNNPGPPPPPQGNVQPPPNPNVPPAYDPNAPPPPYSNAPFTPDPPPVTPPGQ